MFVNYTLISNEEDLTHSTHHIHSTTTSAIYRYSLQVHTCTVDILSYRHHSASSVMKFIFDTFRTLVDRTLFLWKLCPPTAVKS